ncbi:MAG: NAD-dependent epimerase/dehydratase family protein [Acidobacteriota bacterium]
MNVLVTGAAGFIGSHLSEALLAAGHAVTGVDNFDPYYDRAVKERNLKGSLLQPGFRFVELDLKDAPAVRALMAQGWDRVVHLAGRGGVRRSILEPQAYLENNLVATGNILEAMRETGLDRLVFASTSSVYGNRSPIPFREDARADWPISPYSASKKACEVLAYAYHHLHALHVYVLRFFTVYGPRQRPDMAIHKFVRAVTRGEAIERFGDGSTERDYTYVDDIVAAVVRAVERVEGYEIINIGGAQTTSLSRLIELIEDGTGETARIVEKPLPPGDVVRTYADTSKAGRLLDFKAEVPVEEGLRRFIRWYREEPLP